MTWPVPVSRDAKPIVIEGDVAAVIGQRHDLHTALADLIDNSIGVGADDVVIRLLLEGRQPVGVQLTDNGSGMNDREIDKALVMGSTRAHAAGDLGHFGIGLKSASLSQARVVTVISRRAGSDAVGRLLGRGSSGVTVGTLTSAVATGRWRRSGLGSSGTSVEWLDMQGLPATADPNELTRWTENVINELRVELGLRFHRFLSGGLRLTVVAVDGIGSPAIPRRVEPLDPFAYSGTGAAGYPREVVDRAGLKVTAHVWPGRSDAPQFRLGGQGAARQGFFVYRNDRLLQAGGWNSVTSRPDLGLARIEVDTVDVVGGITINLEKAAHRR